MGQRKHGRKQIKISRGEALCGDILRNYSRDVETQYIIPALPYYRFDYYFTYQHPNETNLRHYLFEFDGQQHFNPTPWFHRAQSRRTFKQQQDRDFLKSAVALMHGYYLIRIAYKDLPKLDRDYLDLIIGRSQRLFLSDRNKYDYLVTRSIPLSWFRRYHCEDLGRDLCLFKNPENHTHRSHHE